MTQSLTAAMKQAGGPVALLRNSTARMQAVPTVPPEYTNWRSEQLAWQESCGLLDQSHHMVTVTLEGPDALPFLARIGVNNVEKFPINSAKQLVASNPDGQYIAQGILFRTAEDEFLLVGSQPIMDWVEYNHAITAHRVRFSREGTSLTRQGDPTRFRYEVQGPKALDVMRDCLGQEPPELRFFAMAQVSIAGREVTLVRHGMIGQPGYEIFGAWKDGDVVLDALLESGAKYNMKRTGGLAYFTSATHSGYFPQAMPAIYTNPDLADYRDWLTDRSYEATAPLGGSFSSENIEDYYFTPFALGYGRVISMNHDFIGRGALEAMVESGESQAKSKVTLLWNPEDLAKVYGSFFEGGLPGKFMQAPDMRYSTLQYDRVLHEGKDMGISGWVQASAIHNTVMSLAVVKSELATPGTEVTVIWGEDPNSPKRGVEPHRQMEVRATVAPAPIGDYARTEYRRNR